MPRKSPSEETMLICGRNPVVEALRGRPRELDKVYLQAGASGSGIDEIRALARAASVPVQRMPRGRLDAMAGKVLHQGVVAVGSALAYATLDHVFARAKAERNGRILFLDRVTDPRNLGAVLRSAAAFGVSGVLVPSAESAPLNAAAVKTSAGAALRIPVARLDNPGEALDGMRESGYWIIGADASAPTSFHDMNWARPVVIALGSEDRGLSAAVKRVCDELVSIPMAPGVDSINVSAAASVILSAAFVHRDRQS